MSKHLANVLNLFSLSDYSVALEIVETIGQSPADLILVALKLWNLSGLELVKFVWAKDLEHGAYEKEGHAFHHVRCH